MQANPKRRRMKKLRQQLGLKTNKQLKKLLKRAARLEREVMEKYKTKNESD